MAALAAGNTPSQVTKAVPSPGGHTAPLLILLVNLNVTDDLTKVTGRRDYLYLHLRYLVFNNLSYFTGKDIFLLFWQVFS